MRKARENGLNGIGLGGGQPRRLGAAFVNDSFQHHPECRIGEPQQNNFDIPFAPSCFRMAIRVFGGVSLLSEGGVFRRRWTV